MSTHIALFACLVVGAVQADNADKNRPVSKVITLLKDMVSQLEKEAEEDEEVYETMGCWCETNDKAKTKSIADAEQTISDLTAAIEGFTASAAKLNTEIANLEKRWPRTRRPSTLQQRFAPSSLPNSTKKKRTCLDPSPL